MPLRVAIAMNKRAYPLAIHMEPIISHPMAQMQSCLSNLGQVQAPTTQVAVAVRYFWVGH